MSQNPSAKSPVTDRLNPFLEEALGCLDVQIEEELSRYRKTRSQQPDRDRNNPQITYPQPPPPGTSVLPLTHSGEEVAAGSQTPVKEAIDNQIADFTRETVSDNAKTPENATAASETAAPQEYLASSEQLLRNVADSEAQEPPETQKKFARQLLTPMGIGSMVVLGTAMTLLGTALFYPDVLTQWTGNENTDSSETTSQPTSPDSSASDSPQGETPSSSPLTITGPNLATDEFAPVNPDSLSTVETSPDTTASPTLPTPELSPTSPAPTAPSPPTTPSDLTTALLAPSPPQPDRIPASPSASPSPTPTPESTPDPAPPDPVVENAPVAPGRGDRFYYVVVDYAGASSLQQARAIVPESYVRNFPQGAQIQMGAFSREQDAQSLIARLDGQGVKATIYRRE